VDEIEQYLAVNRARWDESVPIHVASKGYDMDGFLRGEKSLCPPQVEEVGAVDGRTLLHLQCHFGMDTLSWARLGARVSGLDFSAPAIEQARMLAQRIGISDATFVQSSVYHARDALDGEFDIVNTGIGALNWLPDIRGWAHVAAGFVKPGGFLYLYEGHPVLWALADEGTDSALVLSHPYFETPQPSEWETPNTHVDGPPLQNRRTFEWNHGLGEILTAIIEAGLRIEFVHEHREVPWQGLPWMTRSDGASAGGRYERHQMWHLPPDQRNLVPLMYSVKATRDP
jgi:SAM-dependent methyltransferase